jgi:hypothetical protein
VLVERVGVAAEDFGFADAVLGTYFGRVPGYYLFRLFLFPARGGTACIGRMVLGHVLLLVGDS